MPEPLSNLRKIGVGAWLPFKVMDAPLEMSNLSLPPLLELSGGPSQTLGQIPDQLRYKIIKRSVENAKEALGRIPFKSGTW